MAMIAGRVGSAASVVSAGISALSTSSPITAIVGLVSFEAATVVRTDVVVVVSSIVEEDVSDVAVVFATRSEAKGMLSE